MIKNKITFIDNTTLTIEGENALDLYRVFRNATVGLKGWKLDKPILKYSLKAIRNQYILAENSPNFNQSDWVKENIIFDIYTDVDSLLIKRFLDEVVFAEFDPNDPDYTCGDVSFDTTKIGNIIEAICLNKDEVEHEKWLWEIEAPATPFAYYLNKKYAVQSDILIRMNKGGQRMKAIKYSEYKEK
jgi:hypothetical protein